MIEWNNSGVPLLEEFFVKDCGAAQAANLVTCLTLAA